MHSSGWAQKHERHTDARVSQWDTVRAIRTWPVGLKRSAAMQSSTGCSRRRTAYACGLLSSPRSRCTARLACQSGRGCCPHRHPEPPHVSHGEAQLPAASISAPVAPVPSQAGHELLCHAPHQSSEAVVGQPSTEGGEHRHSAFSSKWLPNQNTQVEQFRRLERRSNSKSRARLFIPHPGLLATRRLCTLIAPTHKTLASV